MKYKVGDRVKIKSLNWYNYNKEHYNRVCGGYLDFVSNMSEYCGKEATITEVVNDYYRIDIDNKHWKWLDYMFEETMEERTIKISLDKAREWYRAGGDLKQVALQAYTEEELKGNFKSIKTFDDACKVLGISDLEFKGSKNINWGKQDAQDTFNRWYALGKLSIIRKALNRGYEMKFTKGTIYYPYVFFIGKNCNSYRNKFSEGDFIRISDFIVDNVKYTLVGGSTIRGSYDGIGSFRPNFADSRPWTGMSFLGCATEEIARHMSRYFAKEMFEAIYTGLVDFKWVD